MLRKWIGLTGILMTTAWAGAAELAAAPPAPADKSAFTLWNPSPRASMREMTTDRPDKTESPYTVDAGHVQIEMDLINWTHDHSGGAVTDTIVFAPVNFKIGLSNNMDVQIVYDSYTEDRTRAG